MHVFGSMAENRHERPRESQIRPRGHLRAEQIKLPKICYGAPPVDHRLWRAAVRLDSPQPLLVAGFSDWPGWIAWPLAALCLLLAQRHFQALVHDASHAFYHRKTRINDPQANWLAAGWIGMTVQNYRRIHLEHHAHNGSADDPEHVSFASVAASGGLMRMVLRYVCLLEALRLVRKYYGSSERLPRPAGRPAPRHRPATRT